MEAVISSLELRRQTIKKGPYTRKSRFWKVTNQKLSALQCYTKLNQSVVILRKLKTENVPRRPSFNQFRVGSMSCFAKYQELSRDRICRKNYVYSSKNNSTLTIKARRKRLGVYQVIISGKTLMRTRSSSLKPAMVVSLTNRQNLSHPTLENLACRTKGLVTYTSIQSARYRRVKVINIF